MRFHFTLEQFRDLIQVFNFIRNLKLPLVRVKFSYHMLTLFSISFSYSCNSLFLGTLCSLDNQITLFFIYSVKQQVCTTGLGSGTITRRETITDISARSEQARDMMVAEKTSLHSFDFLENWF